MAHTYITCKLCGTVQRSKLDEGTWQTAQIGLADKCANSLCGSTSFSFVQGKQDVAQLMVKKLAGKILNFGRHIVPGPVRYNILNDNRAPGQPKFVEMTFPNRDIKAGLERLRDGGQLPQDVNGRDHFNDGSRHRGDCLPINDVKLTTTYYTEWGMLSSSRGWEKNLGSERLITGASGEIYYSSLHYRPDWWWVFSPDRGVWTKFKKRP